MARSIIGRGNSMPISAASLRAINTAAFMKLVESLAGRRVCAAKVIIAPAAVDRSKTVQQLDLAVDRRADSRPQCRVVRTMMQGHQPLHAVAVAPNVVEGCRIAAPQMRQVLKQPGLSAIDGRLYWRSPIVGSDQRGHAQRRHCRAEGQMSPGTGAKIFRSLVRSAVPHEPSGLWSSSRNRVPRLIADSNWAAPARRRGMGSRTGLDFRWAVSIRSDCSTDGNRWQTA